MKNHQNLKNEPSESEGQTSVSVIQRKSKSFDVTMLARGGPLFLMDLAFRIMSVRGPGLRDTSPPSRSNNTSPFPLTNVENL